MQQGVNCLMQQGVQALLRLQTLLSLHQADLSVFQRVYTIGPPIIALLMTDCLRLAAKASQPASEANDTAAATPKDPTQQSPSYLSWDAQKAGPSLYRAFLQEFQSPTQGSVGNLVKRLVERAHKHEHQRLTQELSEKEKVLQEQASQLHAMTADRDKWMMDHQQLVVRSSVSALLPACLPECWGTHHLMQTPQCKCD